MVSATALRRFGLDPAWSKTTTFTGADGRPITWHYLDTGPGPAGTIVCVHGNPTWSYLWRGLLETLGSTWRVVAVDQTSMGFSERAAPRGLADRVEELVSFCRQVADGPLVLAAHDWGGPVATGAASQLEVRALILANTAVAKPDDVAVPPLIATARRAVTFTCATTPLFVEGTAQMAAREHRSALRAPYRSAARRRGVADFVADIPISDDDPSAAALARSAANLGALRCPVLLLWGGADPVFHDRFLRDLEERVPQAQVERFDRAGHLVLLDEPVGPLIEKWLSTELGKPPAVPGSTTTALADPVSDLLGAVLARAQDSAAVYLGPDGELSWRELVDRATHAAQCLLEAGLTEGDRVSILVPPSAELLVAACATWWAGGVPVAVDASLGLRQLRSMVRGAAPRFVIGTRASLAAATVLRIAPGAIRLSFDALPGTIQLSSPGAEQPLRNPAPEVLAAVVHTSGATGPAKMVRYTHRALAAQQRVVADLLELGPDEAFTTSFGPFMLLAPVLGVGCVRPDFDVTKASELNFDRLAAAVARAEVQVAWLSPAAARAVINSAAGRSLPLRRVLLAGAPIPHELVTQMAAITGGAVRTPYGMTECLPITDGTAALASGPLGGLSTGRVLPGAELIVVDLNDATGPLVPAGGWGEFAVRAPWMFDGYDHRYSADAASHLERPEGVFHRTGDVGYLHDGLVFQLGRRSHVLWTASGPLASVAIETPIAEAISSSVAAVGIGPIGCQVVCIVVDADGPLRLADPALSARVRRASEHAVAAVLSGSLPVDRRHESKVDRVALRHSADRFLAGR